MLGLIFLESERSETIEDCIVSNTEIRGKRDKYLPTHVIQIVTRRLGDKIEEDVNIFYISPYEKRLLERKLVIPYLIGSL